MLRGGVGSSPCSGTAAGVRVGAGARRLPPSGPDTLSPTDAQGAHAMSDLEQELAEQMSEDEDAQTEDDGEDAAPNTLQHPEGEPVEQVAPPKSQAEIEKMQAQLAAEGERHAKRVAQIMGEDFGLLVPSPVDWTPGFIFAIPEMLPDADALAALDAILGRAATVELREATDAQACETCNALGQVLTGSHVPGQETKPCSTCSGSGWTHKQARLQPVAQFDQGGTGGGFSVAAPNVIQVADAYGRPFGHPHYGLSPASVGA